MSTQPAPQTPTSLLTSVKNATEKSFRRVSVEGRIVTTRENTSEWLTLTLADPDEPHDAPFNRRTRLEVGLAPDVHQAAPRAALAEGAVVHVTGRLDVWVQAARVTVKASRVVRTGHQETPQSYLKAVAAIDAGRYRSVPTPMPLLIGRVLLVAPSGTSLGDITEDLGPLVPCVTSFTIPGDSPQLGSLLREAVRQHPDVDVVVLGRGGVIEQISGWDNEELLAAVTELQQQVPLVVAVGHAQHKPLVSRVAGYTGRNLGEVGSKLHSRNLKAATRIDGLEVLATERLHGRLAAESQRIHTAEQGLRTALEQRIETRAQTLTAIEPRVRQALVADLGRVADRVEAATAALDVAVRRRLADRDDRVEAASDHARDALERRLHDRERRLELTAATLTGFTRGLAIITDQSGGPAQLDPGDRIRIDTADTTAYATVNRSIHHHP